MAVLKDRKRDLYAKTQLLRDEANAPEHLESAGDVLIKELAKKQLDKTTTLEEQLQIRQEFEKGSELKPWKGSGLTTLQDFQELVPPVGPSSSEPTRVDSLETLKARTGLSRHELELGLVEKPGSQNSALYRFALGNRRGPAVADDLYSKLDRHPINRLKEIEEEVFGEKDEEEKREAVKKRKSRRKRTRKRKGKQQGEGPEVAVKENPDAANEESDDDDGDNEPEEKSYRPSLWDVKDMKKFCNNVQQDCKMPNFYTIQNGKIVRINKSPEHG